MLRRKYLAGNLKRENERTIARYLSSLLSHVRDPRSRSFNQNDSRSDDVTKESATVSESSNKEAVDKEIKQSNKLPAGEASVAIKLTPFDRPGPSRSPQYIPKTIKKSDQNKPKTNQHKCTQMRQNLSTQRLQGDEDIDDDSSLVDDLERRHKYILVGWDNFRSKVMVILLVLLVLWAIIYFPLIGT
ncbi:hypothetical protein WH47_03629 [Habropoda laboriosa]|uniref:Uncharacterized protein n=1 Tax=Habropoda laboriosa TaxID=597456 RepID=A0A0L7RII4_9HYME|nr:PREDICTED: uncharacterized protein LOC108573144 [Habropoda laboriosa]KOC70613.1 hypothetical protein WH47_03629 [Habropoda laboriosa]